jgi:DNA invertase Pin-like site-specific DNA recombinase
MDKRVALQDMLQRIKRQRDVDAVLVYKLSRMNLKCKGS